MSNILKIGKACVGCRACEQVCPQNCIMIVPNSEGFLYPVLDETTCIDCGLCLKKCAQVVEDINERVPLHTYALKNKNREEIFASASGGAADVATKVILERKGLVFGVAYTDELVARHIGISADEERYKLQSSKYVQSDMNDCYSQAKEALDSEKNVLFIGTPCQIDGLKSFLGKDYENLITIDLICHGVPSPLFFKKYIKYMGEKMGGNLIEYNFRSKEKRGWGTQYLAKTKTKTKTNIFALDKYGKHFMAGDCYRECCYQCRYANIKNRPGDITIGDFWGIDKCYPKFSSPLGVSSVFVNTSKGDKLLSWMSEYVDLIECSMEEAMVKQGNLISPTNRPNDRDQFYLKINQDNFIENINVGIKIKERIKSIIPRSVITKLKKYF